MYAERLLSEIRRKKNSEFLMLYAKLLELAERYVVDTNNDTLKRVYEKMNSVAEGVEQLDGQLNAPSAIVKGRQEVHGEIQNKVKMIKTLLKAYQLSPSNKERKRALYAYDMLEELLDLKKIVAVESTSATIREIRRRVEEDAALADAMKKLEMSDRVESLCNMGQQFDELMEQQKVEGEEKIAFDKGEIRRQAFLYMKSLLYSVELNYSIEKDEVWKRMEGEVEQLLGVRG